MAVFVLSVIRYDSKKANTYSQRRLVKHKFYGYHQAIKSLEGNRPKKFRHKATPAPLCRCLFTKHYQITPEVLVEANSSSLIFTAAIFQFTNKKRFCFAYRAQPKLADPIQSHPFGLVLNHIRFIRVVFKSGRIGNNKPCVCIISLRLSD